MSKTTFGIFHLAADTLTYSDQNVNVIHMDRQLRFGVILQYTVILLSYDGTYMYYISIERQIIRLSNDINNIRMNKRILLKINREIEK